MASDKLPRLKKASDELLRLKVASADYSSLFDEVCFGANTDPLSGIIDGMLPPQPTYL